MRELQCVQGNQTITGINAEHVQLTNGKLSLVNYLCSATKPSPIYRDSMQGVHPK